MCSIKQIKINNYKINLILEINDKTKLIFFKPKTTEFSFSIKG